MWQGLYCDRYPICPLACPGLEPATLSFVSRASTVGHNRNWQQQLGSACRQAAAAGQLTPDQMQVLGLLPLDAFSCAGVPACTSHKAVPQGCAVHVGVAEVKAVCWCDVQGPRVRVGWMMQQVPHVPLEELATNRPQSWHNSVSVYLSPGVCLHCCQHVWP